MDVTLLVYDLSRGLARQMSMPLLGFQLDAVYHTAVEVNGVEYVYDGGIVGIVPGSSHLGQPMEKVRLGRTQRSLSEISEYLDSIRPQFTAAAYDLLRHNCNNFSDTFARYLVGDGIPAHIANMPAAVLASPMGRMLVEGMSGGGSGGGSNGAGSNGLLGLSQTAQMAPTAGISNDTTKKEKPPTHLHLPSFAQNSTTPVLYAKVPPLDKLLAKMGAEAAETPAVRAVKTYLEARSKGTATVTDADLADLATFVRASVTSLPPDTLFAVVDLFRCCLADPRVGEFFADEQGHATVLAVVEAVTGSGAGVPTTACPYALRLVTLQTACNLFGTPRWATALAGDDNTLRSQLVQLVSASFLDDDHTSVRVAAASLLFNLAVANRGSTLLSTEDQIELVASVVEAIAQEETSDDALRGMLLALGHLVEGVPLAGEVADLLRAVDAAGTILGRAKTNKGQFAEVGSELARGLA